MSAKRFILVLLICFITACHAPQRRYQGYIEGDTLYLAIPFSGTLKAMHVMRGAYVKKGQLLFDLDPDPQSFALQHAQALLNQGEQTWLDLKKSKRIPEIESIQSQVAQADAELVLAGIRVKRNQILFDKHVLDRDSLDAAIEHMHEIQALKAQFEANLALAKLGARPNQINARKYANVALLASMNEATWALKQKKIYAPDDGIIFDTYYKTGEFVGAEHPVASLLTSVNTRIEFFVPLSDLNRVALGQKISYLYPGSEEFLAAQITYISPKAEYVPPLVYSRDNSDKIVFRVKASISHTRKLISGAPVSVVLEAPHDA